MTTYVGAAEAARLLGVRRETLYAYVSRGLIERRTAVDGRTSLYPRDAIDALAARSRSRPVLDRPTIDVRIASAITALDDEGVRYRGHDAAELADRPFESVAELLWTGVLPHDRPRWRTDRELLGRCLGATAGVDDPLDRLAIAATLDAGSPSPPSSGAEAARRLLAVAPTLVGGPRRGTIAERLAVAWSATPTELAPALERALVLLADHELATSTLAVRVAASVRTTPAGALATGLHVVGGALHGAAASAAADLFDRAEKGGAARAVDDALAGGRRLPGFGHSVYRHGDPRFTPLLDAVRALPDPHGRYAIVASVLAAAGRRLGTPPNVDLALAALVFVADLPRDAPIFAVARLAGWGAHYDEELGERPVRFRGLATLR